jgi:hypothetical protein
MYLHGPTENPSTESCEGGFLQSFIEEMRGFHDLLRQKPSSLFILLGQSSTSVASLCLHNLTFNALHGVKSQKIVLFSRTVNAPNIN